MSMSDGSEGARLRLKRQSGWFAAGQEVSCALQLLSDAAFKLFVWLCLHAERSRGAVSATPAELGRTLGKNEHDICLALEELERQGVCSVKAQGAIEIRDRFWPYRCNLELSPIFIAGILPRSGTNFLYQLLSEHPDCQVGGIREDFLLAHADLIVRYAESVLEHWGPKWAGAVQERIGSPKTALCRCLGQGLVSFLQLQYYDEAQAKTSGASMALGSKRLVTKTPSVRNLQHFPTMFPDAHLIILIRDGRALVESGVQSSAWSYNQGICAWAEAAQIITRFDKDTSNKRCKYIITRFEDLVRDTESELRRIFSFLALDPGRYDFSATAKLPVVGSCETRRAGEKEVHWHPVERTPAFNPVERARTWKRKMHERFNWIAGEELEQLGYVRNNASRNQLLWNLWNIALDVKSTIARLERWTKSLL